MAKASKKANKLFTIVHGGGILGDRRVIVSDQVTFQPGEEVVAFLVLNQRGEGVTLGNIGDPKAGPALLRLARASDDLVRLSAVQALGLVHDQEAVPELSHIVDDPAAPPLLIKKAIVSLGHGCPAVPEQVSSGSQTSPEPGLQTVVFGATTSAGHGWSATPVQVSSGSQTSPEPARQTVVFGVMVSVGQGSPAVPVQVSSGSQRSPEPGLQTVLLGATTLDCTRRPRAPR